MRHRTLPVQTFPLKADIPPSSDVSAIRRICSDVSAIRRICSDASVMRRKNYEPNELSETKQEVAIMGLCK